MKISVIIPTMNEPNIGEVIQNLKKRLNALSQNYQYEIIVIDKSTDGTYEKALKEEVIVHQQVSTGYGNAYIEGFKYATGDIFVMVDGDGSYSVEKLSEFIVAIDNKKYDFAIGNRFADLRPGSLTPIKKFGNICITLMIRCLFNIDIKDSQCGLRAFSREFVEKIEYEYFEMNFASEMIIKAKMMNFKMINIPITYYPRIGESKISIIKHGIPIGFAIIRLFFKYITKSYKKD